MTNRLDALSARESNGKTYWTRVGVAFQSKDGTGWNVLLDAMPAPVDGQFKITLMVPKPRDDSGGGNRQASSNSDDIPY
jgi:hypothetical protein